MEVKTDTYDFIVVGAGPAGCAIPSRLASSSFSSSSSSSYSSPTTSPVQTRPKVLLIEAGGPNDGIEHLSGAERFEVAFKPDSPLNWHYKTEPQWGGQRVDYSRGKGLGGSTAINFCGWVVGPADDYDEWARIVGGGDDDDGERGEGAGAEEEEDKGTRKFAWDNVKRVFRDKVERFHDDVPEGYRKWFQPRAEDHGNTGAVDVSYQDDWFDICHDVFNAAEQTPGFGVNPDVNSGDPMGMGMGTLCVYDGRRITSSSAYGLHETDNKKNSNLTVVVDEIISKIVIEDGVAVAVRSASGKEWRASKEIVICTGALNTPHLLLLSGIGPREEIEKHGIKVVNELPHVGRNLQDHCFSTAGIVIKKTVEAGGKKKSAGPKKFPSPMGWFKLPAIYSSREFQELPQDTRDFLKRPQVPNWEIAALTPFFDNEAVHEDEEVFSSMALIMNPQSRGAVTLRSADPRQPPVIDPKFLTHPYDKRNAIESLREMLRYQQAPTWKSRGVVRTLNWPAGSTYESSPDEISDEALWEAVKSRIGSSWHMAGTCRMGRQGAGKAKACVDSAFRVLGTGHLRVADMSVVPRINSNHTQTTAYIIGELAAEQLMEEYGLSRV